MTENNTIKKFPFCQALISLRANKIKAPGHILATAGVLRIFKFRELRNEATFIKSAKDAIMDFALMLPHY